MSPPISGNGGKGSMRRMLKRCSLNHIIETMEKGRITALAIISPVYVSVSLPTIAVGTVPIFLAEATAVHLSCIVLVECCGVLYLNLQHISPKRTLRSSAE